MSMTAQIHCVQPVKTARNSIWSILFEFGAIVFFLTASLNSSAAQTLNIPHDEFYPNHFFATEGYSGEGESRFHFSGEGGAGFFDTESEGQFPNSEFRVDEAKLFVEALIIEDVYAFVEIDLSLREEPEEDLRLGELYLEFEDVSKLWNRDRQLNIRVGRFDIPFGEEYLTRDVIDNPLITHSLIDTWGVDEGIEIYGFLNRFEYIMAVQSGGEPIAKDFDPDKSVAGRLTYHFSQNVHVSGSAMRTGDLNVEGDEFSELWFGNGFLRVLGSPLTTTTFGGRLFEFDAHAKWERGHAHFAVGTLRYDDNDAVADNRRDAHYFQMEAVQNLNKNKDRPWYVATRFSRITADEGFPLVGNGDLPRFLFDNAFLTEELWRASFGAGYRWGRNLLIKAEYNFENGTIADGSSRDNENFFGVEIAARF